MKNQNNNHSTQNVRVISATTRAAELFSALSPEAQENILDLVRGLVLQNERQDQYQTEAKR